MTYSVGDELPHFVIESVSTDAMKLWARFLADPNPIHIDPKVVESKGLGTKVINQGPINVAYMMNALLLAFPTGRIEAMESRFLDNVYGGDRIVAGGHVESIEANRIKCRVTLDVDGRGTVNEATATIVL